MARYFFQNALLPETVAYLAECTTQPAALWTRALDNFIRQCIVDGNWQLLDRMWILATTNQQNARVSIVNPTSTQMTEKPNGGTLTWTQYQGYTGDGVHSYVNTNFTPSTQGVNMQLNSTSFGFHVLTDPVGPASIVEFGTADSGSNGGGCLMIANDTGGDCFWVVNQGNSFPDFAVTTAIGVSSAYRRGSSSPQEAYKNGVAKQAGSVVSQHLSAQPFCFCAYTINGTSPISNSSRQVAMGFVGGGNIDHVKFYNAWNTFFTSI